MAEKVKQYRHPDDPITLDELKGFLWAAATHLRGQIDAAGYKEYIFPLLFFKRISDVYDEQFVPSVLKCISVRRLIRISHSVMIRCV